MNSTNIAHAVSLLIVGLGLAIIPSSYGQYRLVGGNVYPNNSREWTVFSAPIEVEGLCGEAMLRCRTFSVNAETVGSAVVPGQRNFRQGVVTAPVTASVKRYYGEAFIVANYPTARSFKQGDIIRSSIRAMRRSGPIAGIGGRQVTTIYYDCGVPYTPPQRQLTPEETAAAKEIASKQRTSSDSSALKFIQEQAEKGSALYQYRLGLRYVNGEGVTNDLAKAREYFTKAAAQGNDDAARELAKLPSK